MNRTGYDKLTMQHVHEIDSNLGLGTGPARKSPPNAIASPCSCSSSSHRPSIGIQQLLHRHVQLFADECSSVVIQLFAHAQLLGHAATRSCNNWYNGSLKQLAFSSKSSGWCIQLLLHAAARIAILITNYKPVRASCNHPKAVQLHRFSPRSLPPCMREGVMTEEFDEGGWWGILVRGSIGEGLTGRVMRGVASIPTPAIMMLHAMTERTDTRLSAGT
jgi:hypothetical protein